jgi:SAM-dependent methyltransferase
MPLPRSEQDAVVQRYSERFAEHGYSPKTLGWEKGKQDLRFTVLSSQYDFRGKSVLDVGCGFGDLNLVLAKRYGADYRYHGVDLVPVLVEQARALYHGDHIQFSCSDVLSDAFSGQYDYAIASGIFNFKMHDMANYDFIQAVMGKALALCRDGVAFDFLSDKVDYQLEHTFHSSPEHVLGLAYEHSRNVVLRNDYMPFEFSVFVHKDGSFSREDTIFNEYKRRSGDAGR